MENKKVWEGSAPRLGRSLVQPGRRSRTLGVLLLWFQIASCFAPLWAEVGSPVSRDDSRIRSTVRRASQRIEGDAGGWGLFTPLLLGASQLVQGDLPGLKQEFTSRELYTGVGVDLALVAATKALVSRATVTRLTQFGVTKLPLPAPAKILAVTAAGFLGWEAGTDFFQDTEWTNLAAQIGTATAIQLALPALAAASGMAILASPILVTAAAIAGAVAISYAFDRLGLSERGDQLLRATASSFKEVGGSLWRGLGGLFGKKKEESPPEPPGAEAVRESLEDLSEASPGEALPTASPTQVVWAPGTVLGE